MKNLSIHFKRAGFTALAYLLPSAMALSSSIPTSPSNIEPSTITPPQYVKESRRGLLLPGETDVRLLLPTAGDDNPPPYGANLFAGGYESERRDGLNANYRIAPGDQINIWLWGAVNYSNVATVDNQGNIFIPDIGPINVANKKASDINQYVTEQIKKVYTSNVNIYVNLLTSTPVSVFITGPVVRPGQYAGMASDSVLYFLKRAGGIDSERGSYRKIQILRQNSVIEQFDLYQFIRYGRLPSVSFKDGDVILVAPQLPTVNVSGGVRNPFRFELTEHSSGETITAYARPLAKVSHVAINGNRADGPFSLYMPYREFEHFELQDGDSILFNDDLHPQVIDVQISGSYLGPSYFAVNKRTRLHELLASIPVDNELADIHAIHILRASVARRQKEMLNESLDRLERSVFTAPASSDGEAAIRAREAEMVLRFTERARKIEPLGKVIVAENGRVANIQLEPGDQIVIPQKTDLVQIGGEVLMPQAVVFNPNARVDDYIAWAGGFTDRAEDKRIAVVRANGLVEFDPSGAIQKGDQILVLPKVDNKTMQSVKDITQIIYQIAVAANVALK
ncbi:polysaccharide biosynthesis/export family protein [Vibrio metschnikovii]|uniref:polysaccharide biosynthesis/export family protein n=1 Tax=Vibrio metschnikovii TaxID=28172 RepID=UPI001C2F5F2B|nr:polysaccharide biosynthesis/export family protein [Vibrio metschnikovii]EKO3697847.1 polysaccharide biosynthesis/export family protein [Vibrio metschnikovii]EKO3779806.1 polysaccharide biosynthesis/export family protein [Vibrio metschnikovii]EKO3886868.1 polysaccharide biosynthesis/export family protein [Vibrio metschnikovii]EKO3935880.1 polysaccharide biosynthesis/export family protein [Vibrio metschnikovii]